jgi:parallel beta-helix repeat protein
MRTGTLLIGIYFLSITAIAATINVPGDYATIQEAIDNAVNADTVLVAPGVYMENLDFKGKDIHVKSSNGPAVTTIDAGDVGSCVGFASGEGSDAVLEGFTLTNGALSYGGGIYIYQASPTVMGNIISANQSSGIMIVESSFPLIIGNVIIKNDSSGISIEMSGISRIISNKITENKSAGISMFMAGSEIENNEITQNGSYGLACHDGMTDLVKNVISDNAGTGAFIEADVELIEGNIIKGNSGRGLYLWDQSGSSNIRYNVIRENGGTGLTCSGLNLSIYENTIILNHDTDGQGGGLLVRSDPNNKQIVRKNYIAMNTTTGQGGGFAGLSGPMTVDGNLIMNNTANGGGGLYYQSDFNHSAPTFVNNVIIGNESSLLGGGAMILYSAELIHNTLHDNFAGDKGGGLYCHGNEVKSQITVRNTILWDNEASVGGSEVAISGTSSQTVEATVEYSDVKGGQVGIYVAPVGSALNWGSGNIDVDPVFVDSSSGDIHLRFNSPCRDVGKLSWSILDFEGDYRNVGGVTDIGADEFYRHLYVSGDATPGGTLNLRVVGLPGLDVLLLLGSGVFDPPLYTLYGMYYLAPPITVLPLGLIPPDGVNKLDVQVPGGLPVPVDIHMQALVNVQLSNYCLLKIE